jgi:hypothetical protein
MTRERPPSTSRISPVTLSVHSPLEHRVCDEYRGETQTQQQRTVGRGVNINRNVQRHVNFLLQKMTLGRMN